MLFVELSVSGSLVDQEAGGLSYSRGLVPPGLLQDQLSFGVDGEDATHRNAHLLVGEHILHPEHTGQRG